MRRGFVKLSYNGGMVYQMYKWEVPNVWKNWMVGLVLLWLLDAVGWVSFLRVGVLWIAHPAVLTSSYLAENGQRMLRYGQQLNQAARDNLDLNRQIEELRVRADKEEILQAENDELRRELSLAPKQISRGILGRVVVGTGGSVKVWFESPVVVGSMVVGQGRILGVVSAVGGKVASVSEIGMGVGQLPVKRVGDKEPLGNVVREGSELVVKKIPKDVAIAVGSLIVSVGDESSIAPDYPIGVVTDVTAPPESVYQTISLEHIDTIAIGESVIAQGGAK